MGFQWLKKKRIILYLYQRNSLITMSSIRILKTFVAVATEGSFAAATQQVALTQAAIGLQMRTLEDELKRPLFDRQGKHVRLNEAGRALLPQVRSLVEQYAQMRASSDASETLAGTLKVGAVVSAVRPLLQAALALKRQYPALDLHVSAAKSADLVAKVRAGELDAAIAVQTEAQAATVDLVWTALYTEPMVVLVPRTAPDFLPKEMLQTQPFIRFDRSEHTGQLVERIVHRLRAKPSDLLELNTIETMVDLVRAQFGVTILPQLRGAQWAQDKQLRVLDIPGAVDARRMALVQLRMQPKARLINALAQELLTPSPHAGRA
jgi:DNA-binding transcriptional LysR family regulator